MPASALDDYMASYGARLQSLLRPQLASTATDTSAFLGRDSAPQPMPQGQGYQVPQPMQAPPSQFQSDQPDSSALASRTAAAKGGGRVDVSQTPMPGDQQQGQPQQPQQGGTSIDDVWKGLPEKEQEKHADALEATLKKGNESIDSAYNEMEQQLGTRPQDGLTRLDKAKMLTEFGLTMMSNAAKQRSGTPVDKSPIEAYSDMGKVLGTRGQQWDQKHSALEAGRAGAKAKFGTDSALEIVKNQSKPEAQPKDTDEWQTVTAKGGLYQRNKRTGEMKRMKDPESGSLLQPDDADARVAGTNAGRPFEFQVKYKQYMDNHGADADGKPLTGPALAKVQREAEEYAGDARKFQMSDAEMRQKSEEAADKHMQSFADSYRGMDQRQVMVERNKIADQLYSRYKRGLDPSSSAFEKPSGQGLPGMGRNSAPPGAINFLNQDYDGRIDAFEQKYGFRPARGK